ncbi:hypothetical protein D3C81_1468070 [compost metagenome]
MALSPRIFLLRASTSASLTRSTLLMTMRSAQTIWSTAWLSTPSSCRSSRCWAMCLASTMVTMASSSTSSAIGSLMKKLWATGYGSARPLVSIRMWSSRTGRATSSRTMRTRSSRTSAVQHTQPLTIS